MIRQPNNWNEVREPADRAKLPVGAYVCKIKQAIIQSNKYGEQLCLLFDIVEGEYSGYYAHDFAANTAADKKWKGVLRLFIPVDDGSEKDEWTKSTLKGMVTAFEKSNYGYKWNWNEKSLVGLLIGILYRNEEWEYNGKHGWSARPFRAISVETVRNGDFTLPKEKPLKKENNSYSCRSESYDSDLSYRPASAFAELDDSDLPFN